MVLHEDAQGNTVECATKNSIEQACCSTNELKYRQSEDTPFMTPPLQPLLGYLGDQDVVQQILAGTFEPPPGLDQYTLKFIHHLQMPEAIKAQPRCPSYISTAQHINDWKKARERTSAASKKRNLGSWTKILVYPKISIVYGA
ncbi:MAG TPA: hypothetical protein V6D20_10315, partial [Candidatus Obscuribacterales bacterium]